MGHELDTLEDFCHCLVGQSCMHMDPIYKVRKPGGRGPLPSFLGSSRVGELLSNSFFSSSFRNEESELVLGALCMANLHLSRLANLGNQSVSFRGTIVGMAKGQGGREGVPFKTSLHRLVRSCLLRGGREKIRDRKIFFMSKRNRQLDGTEIHGLMRCCLNLISALGGGDPRILQRAFTASVLGRRTSLRSMGRLLKRRDVSAARMCARVAFRRLGGVCGRTRPETWGSGAVRMEVRTVRFSTARGLRRFVRGGMTGFKGVDRRVEGMRISLGIMGPRAIVGGRMSVGILTSDNRFFTRGIYSAFRRTMSVYLRTLRHRLSGCGRGRESRWGGAIFVYNFRG